MTSRFLIFLSFFIIFLTSSITFAVKCPDGNNTLPSDSDDEFTVFLDTTKAKDHKDLLIKCLKRRVEKFKSGQGRFNSDKNQKVDKGLVTDYSPGDELTAYSGFFDAGFVRDYLSKLIEVKIAEKSTQVKVDYAFHQPIFFEENNLKKRTTQTSAPPNLDRIDQKAFPLDGRFNFPTNAGLETNVYVLDTGIAIDNVEFEGRARFGGSFCSGCSLTDDHGHGTNVAGIIGGKKFGVSKKTKLISVKILDQNGQGSSVTVVAGLSFVISEHKKSSNKNTVINMSFGGAFSQTINTMVSDCVNAGIHVVVSAGDKASDACNVSPASAPQAITVGATETTDSVATFSNIGSCVDIYAPGRDIVAAGANLTTSLSKASGTSQSCPHVSGTIALIISKQGNSSPSSMATTLINLSVKNIIKNATPNRFLLVPSP